MNPKIENYPNGRKSSEMWIVNGMQHRIDGPAYQSWYENGLKCVEKWHLNAHTPHRFGGPARRLWDESGKKLLNNGV
jgi:hypothetical protein